jgi:predicted Zn-dependent protease
MVKRVGSKIKAAVESYFSQNNLAGELAGYKWEFTLIEDSQVNAFCMPGGKVVVYTGILPVTKTETCLAVVLGHEIAHAVARHGDERMSQEMLSQMGSTALEQALSKKSSETKALWMSAFGIGSQIGVLLPYSRLHESEADRLGLIFMAMAGYDPNEAIPFWQRMAASAKGKTAEFLSTHPSDATRISDIKKELPEALKYYRK